jgi:cytidine deaminase
MRIEPQESDTLVNEMYLVARMALEHAYVPNCRFPVSACIKATGPSLFVGVNIENTVPSQSICAETTALGAMVASGQRRLEHLVVLGGREDLRQFCPPCGGCRQRLLEFADEATLVHLFRLDGQSITVRLYDLIPHVLGRTH